MAFTQFATPNWIHKLGTNEKLLLARYKVEKSGELSSYQAHMGCVGTALGSESLRMGVYLNASLNTAYALSDPWFVLDIGAEIETTPTGNFAAAVVFQFDRVPMNKNSFYYITLEASGYTRVANTHYLYAWKDYFNYINAGGLTSAYGINRPGKFSTILEITDTQ